MTYDEELTLLVAAIERRSVGLRPWAAREVERYLSYAKTYPVSLALPMAREAIRILEGEDR